jgi:hypothetical protein
MNNEIKETIEIYAENEKIYIRNLQDHVENIKDTIKNIEEIFNTKSYKRKVDKQHESGFDLTDVDKFKDYLINDLNISKDYIKILSLSSQNCDNAEEQKKKEKNILNKINKKINLQFVKEKNKNKTFLCNISIFLEETETQSFCKKLQKILGSSSILNQDGDCGFSGDYTTDTSKKEIIKKFILDNTKITKEYIDF